MNAGVSLPSNKLALRLVGGAWCLLGFVLVTAYQSVLISFILTPVMEQPLVNSLVDAANKKDVIFLVDKDLALDLAITVIEVFMLNQLILTTILTSILLECCKILGLDA